MNFKFKTYLSEKGFLTREIYAHSCEHQQYLITKGSKWWRRCLDWYERGIKITLKTLKFNYTYLHT